MKKFCLLLIVSLILSVTYGYTQPLPVADPAWVKKYPFVSTIYNRIQHPSALDTFFAKLQVLQQSKEGRVSIVHIGDSHIQPDFLSSVIRNEWQKHFGDGGRGLVFPYQLAQSNSADDIRSSSPIKWQFNRLAHPEIQHPYGISGFGISTMNDSASISLSWRPAQTGFPVFDSLQLFLGKDSSINWQLKSGGTIYPLKVESQGVANISVDPGNTALSISASNNGSKELYGLSLYHKGPGLVLHTIGVNGACYDQYNTAGLFWEQLPSLRADLYIISLGTNEAQRSVFNASAFQSQIDLLISKLRSASPGAAILLTTAPDSYKGRSSNKILQQVNNAIVQYANGQFIPVWDLYRITNGYGSAYSWARRGLMSRDRIHFTSEGYRIMGTLLSGALARAYNDYLKLVNGN